MKPLEPFLAWCHGLEAPQAIAILGGGAAAVEVALALAHRGLKPSLLLRGEQLFVVAVKRAASPTVRYPAYLYEAAEPGTD